MRTLSRPMFNMGGPIKEGIMHGIREPKKNGGLSQQFNTGLVGDERYPKTKGREHHVGFLAPLLWGGARMLARPFARQVMKQIPKLTKVKWKPGGNIYSKGYPGGAGKGAWERGATISSPQKVWEPTKLGSWFAKDPLAKSAMTGAGWTGKGLKYAGKGIKRGLTTPSGLAVTGGTAYMFWPDGTKKTDEEIIQTGGVPGGGDPGMTYTKPGPSPKSQAEKDAFAKSQREKRVNKYLDLMGYDRSKKLAIADALIDASKIVGERGTLDPKNITKELINPIIQATSKRLDKPGQIREAVGLMMTKADLEKEMYEAKPGTVLKNVQDMVKSGQYTEKEAWAIATKEPRGPSDVITSHMASKRGSLDAEDLAIIMRDYGAKNDVPVGVISKSDIIKEYGEGLKEYPTAMEIITDKKITDDGIYVIGKEVIQITGGKPLQLA